MSSTTAVLTEQIDQNNLAYSTVWFLIIMVKMTTQHMTGNSGQVATGIDEKLGIGNIMLLSKLTQRCRYEIRSTAAAHINLFRSFSIFRIIVACSCSFFSSSSIYFYKLRSIDGSTASGSLCVLASFSLYSRLPDGSNRQPTKLRLPRLYLPISSLNKVKLQPSA